MVVGTVNTSAWKLAAAAVVGALAGGVIAVGSLILYIEKVTRL